jgi:plastocyanin
MAMNAVVLALVGRVFCGEQPAARPVVLLDPVEGTAAPSPSVAHLDEVWLSFVPKVQVVAPGSTLVFTARDADSHTVHAWYGRHTLFNQASVPNGPEQRVVLDRPGVVTVTCDLHAEMRAWVLVSESPRFAVGDVDGTFTIGAPPGRYRVRAWLPGDAEPTALGERELGPGPLELRLPARAHAAAEPQAPSPATPRAASSRSLPGWMQRLSTRRTWPTGTADWVLSILGTPMGFCLVWALFWLGARRRWSMATCVLLGCGLAFVFGALSVVGLSAAVATGFGFGAFIGTILVGAQRVSLR